MKISSLAQDMEFNRRATTRRQKAVISKTRNRIVTARRMLLLSSVRYLGGRGPVGKGTVMGVLEPGMAKGPKRLGETVQVFWILF